MLKVVNKTFNLLIALIATNFFCGCASHPALVTPDYVDLKRFMGRWYIVGYTPILVDENAYNAIEHYRLDHKNKIQTTYQFRKGSFNGDLKTYTPVGWVYDESTNAEWRMQFIWPLRSDYIILFLESDYSRTIVVHPNRKYAWIMQREPEISDEDYEKMLLILESKGYDRQRIISLPQDWSREGQRIKALEAADL